MGNVELTRHSKAAKLLKIITKNFQVMPRQGIEPGTFRSSV